MAAAGIGAFGTAIAGLLGKLGASPARAAAIGGGADKGARAISEIAFVKQGLEGLAGTLKSLGGTALSLISPLTPLNAAFSALTGVIESVVEHVTGLGKALSQFVQYANPAVVQVFEFAFRDLMASFGHAFIPMLQFATATTRGLADVVYKLAPAFIKLTDAVFTPLAKMVPQLVDALEPLLNGLSQLMIELGAFGPVIADVVRNLAPVAVNAALSALVVTLGAVAGAAVTLGVVFGPLIAAFAGLGYLARKLLGELGLLNGSGVSGRSVGAAVTNVKTGSVEAFAEEHWKNAFMSGNGPRPEEQTVSILDKIYTLLQEKLGKAERAAGDVAEAGGVALGASGLNPALILPAAGLAAARELDPWIKRTLGVESWRPW